MAFGLPRLRTVAVGAVGAFVGQFAYGALFKEGPDDPTGFVPLPAPEPGRFGVTDAVRLATVATGVVMALKMFARGK